MGVDFNDKIKYADIVDSADFDKYTNVIVSSFKPYPNFKLPRMIRVLTFDDGFDEEIEERIKYYEIIDGNKEEYRFLKCVFFGAKFSHCVENVMPESVQNVVFKSPYCDQMQGELPRHVKAHFPKASNSILNKPPPLLPPERFQPDLTQEITASLPVIAPKARPNVYTKFWESMKPTYSKAKSDLLLEQPVVPKAQEPEESLLGSIFGSKYTSYIKPLTESKMNNLGDITVVKKNKKRVPQISKLVPIGMPGEVAPATLRESAGHSKEVAPATLREPILTAINIPTPKPTSNPIKRMAEINTVGKDIFPDLTSVPIEPTSSTSQTNNLNSSGFYMPRYGESFINRSTQDEPSRLPIFSSFTGSGLTPLPEKYSTFNYMNYTSPPIPAHNGDEDDVRIDIPTEHSIIECPVQKKRTLDQELMYM